MSFVRILSINKDKDKQAKSEKLKAKSAKLQSKLQSEKRKAKNVKLQFKIQNYFSLFTFNF